MSNSIKNGQVLFPNVSAILLSRQQRVGVLCLPTSSPTLDIVSPSGFNNSGGTSPWFSFVYLMTVGTEHLFLCLFCVVSKSLSSVRLTSAVSSLAP